MKKEEAVIMNNQNNTITKLAETTPLLISAGPYKRFSCMSAYGIDAQKMADAANMLCWTQDEKIRLFSLLLFNPENS